MFINYLAISYNAPQPDSLSIPPRSTLPPLLLPQKNTSTKYEVQFVLPKYFLEHGQIPKANASRKTESFSTASPEAINCEELHFIMSLSQFSLFLIF